MVCRDVPVRNEMDKEEFDRRMEKELCQATAGQSEPAEKVFQRLIDEIAEKNK